MSPAETAPTTAMTRTSTMTTATDTTTTATTTPTSSATRARIETFGRAFLRHLKRHMGTGVVCAVAYFDPGNWGVDLQAGSTFGYRLLFVVLFAGMCAMFLQVLATRLGVVTGLDLASQCRLLLHSRPKHKRVFRWILLYPLYVVSEVAIIATDLAELIGSAIALCMIIPSMPLWAGVLITAFDVLVILAFGDPLRGRPVRGFEALIAVLVLAVLICMAIIIAKIDVHWGNAFFGYVPSKYIFLNGGLYTSVGILGSTVMPHSFFLGSALATQDRMSLKTPEVLKKVDSFDSKSSIEEKPAVLHPNLLRRGAEAFVAAFRAPTDGSDPNFNRAKSHAEHTNNPLPFIRAHLYHGIIDIVTSLLGFAVLINSMILILASAVFYYGDNIGSEATASLFDAYDVIREVVGKPAGYLFAIALLAAGQSSSIIATVAGQAVSEGFLQWRISPLTRRLLTRLLSLIPSMVVAVGVGRSGIDTLLVASQVVLSVVLPFIATPLLWLTSSKSVMTVRVPRAGGSREGDVEGGEELVDFSNGWLVVCVGTLLIVLVTAANCYVLVTLGTGQ